MSKRIKVLHLQVICNIRVSDLQEEIIAALPVQEFEVVTAYMIGNPDASGSGLHSASERVKYFNFSKKELKGLRISVLKEILSFCRVESFDVVITHRFKAMDTMMKLNKLLKIPHCIGVVHNLDDYNRFYRKLNAALFLDEKWTVVTVSQVVNDYLCKSRYAFDCNKVITINNAIDTDKMLSRLYSRADARKQLNLHESDFVFGSIGRMVNVKGYTYLIESFYKLYKSKKDENLKLILVGAGNLKSELTKKVQYLGMEGFVIFPGEIVDAKLLMPAFDVFVLSSLSEGFSLVVLEAMAAQIPVVATNVGVVPSIITKKDEIIYPKDVERLLEVMEKYYNLSEIERGIIGSSLLDHLRDQFDIKQYRKKYYELVLAH